MARGVDARGLGELLQGGADVGEGEGGVLHRVQLVDREDDGGHAQQLGQQRVRRVCGSSSSPGLCHFSLVASTSTTAASAPEAAVTMLRVYCSWPGASPMMNLRAGVAK